MKKRDGVLMLSLNYHNAKIYFPLACQKLHPRWGGSLVFLGKGMTKYNKYRILIYMTTSTT
jgi:hypothetical protein